MANKKRAKQQVEEEPFVPLDELFTSIQEKLLGLTPQKAKTLAYTGGVISVVLITISSLMFYFNWLGSWIPALIGSPAGVILYLIGLGLVYRAKIGEWEIFRMRENYSFKQRLRRVLITLAVYAAVMITIGRFIPYGLGGAILIVTVMTAIATCRRTPEETLLLNQGLPDPRDLEEEDEKDNYATEVPLEGATEADTIYYDEEHGNIGGKLK